MANCVLSGAASTQSRGRRPLPPGAVSARTLQSWGVTELVEFAYADGSRKSKELLTWVCGQWGGLWGSPMFDGGHGQSLPPEIQAVINDEHSETPGSYGHAAEWELADALGVVFDHHLTSDAMSVRFFQSGGEACSAAARIARKATGREIVASSGYHGAGAEWAHKPADGGIPSSHIALHKQFDFGNTAAMKTLAKEAACIMVEVPTADNDFIRRFLLDCRQACDANNIPFIVDDVVLGFRVGLAGSCERYGVKADVVVLGKAMSATGCVSAVIGRGDLVSLLGGGVFYSTTFGGSPGPCAVAAATVRWLTENRKYVYGGTGQEDWECNDGRTRTFTVSRGGYLEMIGAALRDGFNSLGIVTVGQPERSAFQFASDEAWLAWCSKMIARGVMVHRPNFPSLAHTRNDVEKTLEVAASLLHE